MGTVAQRSFAGGELSPAIYPRCDTTKYVTGARTIRNFFVKKHGGVSNRPGTSFVAEIKASASAARLVPFRHTEALTFVLEFGNQSVRGVQLGEQIKLASQAITAITNANPCVVTYAGADYSNGDQVHISGIVGPIGDFLNGRDFLVANVNAGANTFELDYLDGSNVNSTAFGLYTSGGILEEVYEIADTGGGTLPTAAQLPDVQTSQSENTLTVVHPSYPIRELVAASLTSWTNQPVSLTPALLGPEGLTGVAGGAGANTYKYVVTSVKEDDFEESLIGARAVNRTINNGTAANPVVFTTTAVHNLTVGDRVYLVKALEWASGTIADGFYTVSAVGSTTTFSIAQNTTGFGAWVGFLGEATCRTDFVAIKSAAEPTAAAPNVLSWTAVSGAREYNIYRDKQGIYGYCGSTTNTTYNDIGTAPDLLENPPEDRNNINDASNKYPGVVGSIQQRRAFARTNSEPQAGWATRTALPNNMTLHYPLDDSDSVKFKLAGEQNEIRHILDLGSIVLLTAGGEWILQGDGSGVLTPTQVNPKQMGYNGSAKIKPVLINNNALYVQARGNIIRDLAFDYQVDGYRGNDLTIFSSHLFEGYTIVDWAYQQSPNSIVWAVRSDGVLLGLTYLREQDIWAWHRHDTVGGIIESVCTVPEGEEDALYMIVKRTINGASKRYIERLNTRVVDDDTIEDCVFMDCSKSFDGRHTGVVTMTLSGGTTWTYEETLTLTASAASFTSADVGKAVHLVAADGEVIRFTINAYSSTTVVTGKAHKTVPVAMRSVAIGNGSGSWALAIKILTGLWHLEGKTVSVFADGYVVGSPNNEAYTTYTVANGKVTLDRPYAVIHVGLPITADLETLDIDTVQGETLVDKKKLSTKFTAWFEKSRGLFSGPKPPTDDDVDPLEGLYEMRWRENETQEEAIELFTGTKTDLIKSEWNSGGRVFLRQVDPVPLSVLGIAPSGMIPFRSGG